MDPEAFQAAGLVRAGPVVDHLGAVAVQTGTVAGFWQIDQPADDLGLAGDLGVALPVAEVVAVDRAVPAVAVGALAAAREHRARDPVAVDVVANALLVAEAVTAVVVHFHQPAT